ncbi:hypothetical protein PQQ32_13165 [Brachyspira hyodysenteriae]|uniref:hypothetical protein n=1 Tax=Brachyspira hyodysenteriae TaxID=159 RepID=UPI00063D9406|nr:hypothetical protein [Brachyspira hyodysenteriae]KLI60583.1 hypothetical protein SZ44_04640 [Brachyspira hyodysenteriae]WPC37821.1 hypothetical protein PQQ32_13165 [Brachyspira hyodysenteriae]
MYKIFILIILSFSIIIGSCEKKEIISVEKGVVDHRFTGSWQLNNGNEIYTFFNNNKIEYINNDGQEKKVYTYEWKKEGSSYYYRLWNNALDSWSNFPIKYINTNTIKIYSDFFKKSYI